VNAELVVLRLVHVVGGVVWVGSATYMSLVLAPAVASAGEAAGAVMPHIQRQRLFVWLPWIAVITMLAGIRLMQVVSGGFSEGYLTSRLGVAIISGAVMGLAGFLLAVLVTRPSMVRATGMLKGRASAAPAEQSRIDAEVSLLRGRAARSGLLSTTLLLASAAAMGVARYV